jgi:hypothetical protein
VFEKFAPRVVQGTLNRVARRLQRLVRVRLRRAREDDSDSRMRSLKRRRTTGGTVGAKQTRPAGEQSRPLRRRVPRPAVDAARRRSGRFAFESETR